MEEDLYNAAFGRRYSIYKKENSFEDLIAKKMDLENNIIDWQELIKKVLAFFMSENQCMLIILK